MIVPTANHSSVVVALHDGALCNRERRYFADVLQLRSSSRRLIEQLLPSVIASVRLVTKYNAIVSSESGSVSLKKSARLLVKRAVDHLPV